MSYRRDAFTWTAFGALFAFGYLNAVLGPSLPYIRSVEGISYVVGALHQVAFALGGGLAGALSARDRIALTRRTMIAGGLAGGALAGLAVGYGETAPITIAGAFLMGLFASLALIRIWGALADRHGPRRAVAMTEGEVAVSLAGIATPLLIGALAATAATWRLAFAIGTVTAVLAAVVVLGADVPAPQAAASERRGGTRAQPTLVIIFAIVALEFALSFWLASYLNDDVGLARNTAVAMVSGLYASNLLGRLAASRLARTQSPERVLVMALGSVHPRPAIAARRHQRDRGRGRHRPRRRRHRCTLSPDFLAAHPGQRTRRRQRARRDSHRCRARDDQRAAHRRRDRPGHEPAGRPAHTSGDDAACRGRPRRVSQPRRLEHATSSPTGG